MAETVDRIDFPAALTEFVRQQRGDADARIKAIERDTDNRISGAVAYFVRDSGTQLADGEWTIAESGNALVRARVAAK